MFTNFLPCSHAINPNNEICLVTCATWLMCVHFFLPSTPQPGYKYVHMYLTHNDHLSYSCGLYMSSTLHTEATPPTPMFSTCSLPCTHRQPLLSQCSLQSTLSTSYYSHPIQYTLHTEDTCPDWIWYIFNKPCL